MIKLKQKYVRTKDDKVIVFSELIQHSEFRHMGLKSAGFMYITLTKVSDGEGLYTLPDVKVYGSSVSLGLSPMEDDRDLLLKQILRLTRDQIDELK